MADSQTTTPNQPTLSDGVIRFPQGTNITEFRLAHCGDKCPVSLECTGPYKNGGDARAEFPSGKLTDEDIQNQANCLRRIES